MNFINKKELQLQINHSLTFMPYNNRKKLELKEHDLSQHLQQEKR